jgi:hypothetical protein
VGLDAAVDPQQLVLVRPGQRQVNDGGAVEQLQDLVLAGRARGALRLEQDRGTDDQGGRVGGGQVLRERLLARGAADPDGPAAEASATGQDVDLAGRAGSAPAPQEIALAGVEVAAVEEQQRHQARLPLNRMVRSASVVSSRISQIDRRFAGAVR